MLEFKAYHQIDWNTVVIYGYILYDIMLINMCSVEHLCPTRLSNTHMGSTLLQLLVLLGCTMVSITQGVKHRDVSVSHNQRR